MYHKCNTCCLEPVLLHPLFIMTLSCFKCQVSTLNSARLQTDTKQMHIRLAKENYSRLLRPTHGDTDKIHKMTYPFRVICGNVRASLGLLVIQSRARQKSL